MDADGCTPSQQKVRSFLGMVLFYQHFILACSRIAKPLYALTAGQRRIQKGCNGRGRPGTYRQSTSQDWTSECEKAFEELKNALLSCAVLAHPDFDRPFILSTDASTDGLGAVLSQVPAGEERVRPVAFATSLSVAARPSILLTDSSFWLLNGRLVTNSVTGSRVTSSPSGLTLTLSHTSCLSQNWMPAKSTGFLNQLHTHLTSNMSLAG